MFCHINPYIWRLQCVYSVESSLGEEETGMPKPLTAGIHRHCSEILLTGVNSVSLTCQKSIGVLVFSIASWFEWSCLNLLCSSLVWNWGPAHWAAHSASRWSLWVHHLPRQRHQGPHRVWTPKSACRPARPCYRSSTFALINQYLKDSTIAADAPQVLNYWSLICAFKWLCIHCFQSSVGATSAAPAPSFQSIQSGPYAPYNRAPGTSYSQFGVAPLAAQPFGSAGATGKDWFIIRYTFKTSENEIIHVLRNRMGIWETFSSLTIWHCIRRPCCQAAWQQHYIKL